MGNSSHGRNVSFILIAQTLLYFFGIYVFTRGFLLNRIVVPKNSTCKDEEIFIGLNREANDDHCWMKPRFKRAVLLLIDALRYDFMVYNETLEAKDELSFQNKLKVIHEVLKEMPKNGRKWKFVADPPTTTMQRIKGITTGGLPTFIDVGGNFASSEIREDNVITQLKNLGKTTVFIGDETWMGLFPGGFSRQYPYPSFNVKDLHTVDDGVISHLIPEIKRPDWDVVIAHFLGVDHCGHRYGPYHQAMAEKLMQMNDVLRSVIDSLDNDTILMVFGDHGMTRTGDHGGDSDNEIQAGLFVYSPMPIFRRAHYEDVIFQTDIVPTLSLLLGSPIPFSNLGIVVPSLFDDLKNSSVANDDFSRVEALRLNVLQVQRYLKEYSLLSSDISSDALKEITESLFRQLNFSSAKMVDRSNFSSNSALAKENAYLTYLKDVRELCRTVWAKFDLPVIQTGIFSVSITCFSGFLFSLEPKFILHDKTLTYLFQYGFLSLISVVMAAYTFSYKFVWIFCIIYVLSCGLLLYSYFLAYIRDNVKLLMKEGLLVIFVFTLQFLGHFSNSYVVNEDKILLFLIQTVLFICGTNCLLENVKYELGKTKNLKEQKKNYMKKLGLFQMVPMETKRQLGCVFGLMVVVRLGSLFWPCREEQVNCVPEPIQNLQQNGYRLLASVGLFLLVPGVLIFWLKASSNLYEFSFSSFAVKYALPFGAFFGCVHWLLQYVPPSLMDQNFLILFIHQILAPCILYSCCFLVLCCIVYKPITAFFVLPSHLRKESILYSRPLLKSIVEIFKHLRRELSDFSETSESPNVYGLGTVYSSALLIVLVCVALPSALVLGDGLGPSVTLIILEMYLLLEFDRKAALEASDGKAMSFGSLLFSVLTWSQLSSYNFYASGHQATIPSIRFEAAFVGLPGDMKNLLLPGFLILLNTLASEVLFVVALPLIMFVRKRRYRNRTSASENQNLLEEFVYHENPKVLRCDLFRVCSLYQVCKALRLLGAMSAAAVHRRHLMVWKIFAPKFLFEGVSFIATLILTTLMSVFVLRIDIELDEWCKKLQFWTIVSQLSGKSGSEARPSVSARK